LEDLFLLTRVSFDPKILIMVIKISPFDRLVAELTNNERKELLEKIQASVKISNAPIIILQSDPGKRTATEEEYRDLPFFLKFVIWIKILITGRDKNRVEFTNYGDIGGRKNKQYIVSLGSVSRLIDRSVVLLSKIYTFEKSKPDYIIDLN